MPAFQANGIPSTKAVAVTTTSARTALDTYGCPQAVVTNVGPGAVAVRFGPQSTSANLAAVFPTTSVAGDYVVLAGQTVTLTKGQDANTVALVSDSTATVYVTTGGGE